MVTELYTSLLTHHPLCTRDSVGTCCGHIVRACSKNTIAVSVVSYDAHSGGEEWVRTVGFNHALEAANFSLKGRVRSTHKVHVC